MRDVDMKDSHYLHERYRIIPEATPREPFTDRDADYNIYEGITFGESEEITIEKQGWNGRVRR